MKVKCSLTGARVELRKWPSRVVKKPFLVLMALVLVCFANSAGAIETTRASAFSLNTNTISKFQTDPSLNQVDNCLSLLKKVRHGAVTTGSDSLRRPAGKKAATVGFVLGLRIALGPTEVTGPNRVSIGPQIVQTRDSFNGHALAIADYRTCKNKQALQFINNNTRMDR